MPRKSEPAFLKILPPSVVNINFDCAFDASSFRTVAEVVGRNDRGTVLRERWAFHENVAFAFAAEALACQLAVKLGLEEG